MSVSEEKGVTADWSGLQMFGIHGVGVVESSWIIPGHGPHASMARRQQALYGPEMEARVTLMMMLILLMVSISTIVMKTDGGGV